MKLNIQLFGGRGASSSVKREITADNLKLPKELSKKQVMEIKDIASQIPRFDFYGDDYEIKKFDVKADKLDVGDKDMYSVSVVVETGRKKDEGTLASVIMRKRRQFWVGKNGGIKVFDKNHNFKRVSKFELLNKYYER